MNHKNESRIFVSSLALLMASGCTLSSDDDTSVPEVGDKYEGGWVSWVAPNSDKNCREIRVEHPPEWDCSDELKSLANGASAPTYGAQRPEDTRTLRYQLEVTTCAELAALQRYPLKQRELANIDSQLQSQLRKCQARTETFYLDSSGQRATACTTWGYADASAALPVVDDGPPTSAGARETTTTNNQVANIDEADLVKNDNQYVYVASANGVHIIDAWPAADTHQVALIPTVGTVTRLFLYENKLAIYVGAAGGSGTTCTYGYSCRSNAEAGPTQLLVFDVAQPSQPVAIARYAFSGGFSAARRIGSVVHTVVADGVQVSAPGVTALPKAESPEQLLANYEAAKANVEEAIDAMPDESFLPWVEQRTVDGQRIGGTTGCDHALLARAASGETATSLVSIDLATLGAPKRTVVATKPGFVYASADALYIATDGEDGGNSYFPQAVASTDQSTIHKIRLTGTDSSYVGSALIPGHVLNQFSMDEREGVLRVATTNGWVPDINVSSNIVTLGERAGDLSVLGKLSGLAPTEDIRSVRFDGERAFVVTFKKTDPLFAIGLSDPSAPRVLGELKIPGYSTYMHPLDRDHVLAIGFDADDHGSFAYFNGIQIQIFDVADLSAPKLLHKATIGTRGSTSEALTNHLAFTYFASRGLLALPMTICEGGGNGTYGSNLTFSGLMVFDATVAGGIKERGRMPFADESSSFNCGSWWTDAKSLVKRSIFMDDFAIGISARQYKVAPVSALGSPLKTLSFE